MWLGQGDLGVQVLEQGLGQAALLTMPWEALRSGCSCLPTTLSPIGPSWCPLLETSVVAVRSASALGSRELAPD